MTIFSASSGNGRRGALAASLRATTVRPRARLLLPRYSHFDGDLIEFCFLGRPWENFVQKFLVAAASLFTLAAPALAADMAVKAPPSTMAVSDSWTGFYVGGELGGERASSTWTTTFVNPYLYGLFPLDGTSPRSIDPSSVRGGVYLGYNWQFASQWVGGVEFDWADADARTSTLGIPGCSSAACVPFPFPGESSQGDAASVKLGWDASARARLGYLVSPSLLLYGTGGVAWQRLTTSATCQFSGVDPICISLAGSPFATASSSTTRTGWTIGGGIETKLSANWILRGEYRYSDFGTVSNQAYLVTPAAPLSFSTIGYQLNLKTQIATIGIAYKFGGPVVAKY
jgi:outer membrane immunogenic protein